MTRAFIAAIAVSLALTTLAHARAHARPGWESHMPIDNSFGPGEYDRLVNGSDASTPGHN
jgi:hypothetical protein